MIPILVGLACISPILGVLFAWWQRHGYPRVVAREYEELTDDIEENQR